VTRARPFHNPPRRVLGVTIALLTAAVAAVGCATSYQLGGPADKALCDLEALRILLAGRCDPLTNQAWAEVPVGDARRLSALLWVGYPWDPEPDSVRWGESMTPVGHRLHGGAWVSLHYPAPLGWRTVHIASDGQMVAAAPLPGQSGWRYGVSPVLVIGDARPGLPACAPGYHKGVNRSP
jgi:hypothetical protein